MLITLESGNRGMLDISRFTDPRARAVAAAVAALVHEQFVPFTTIPLNVLINGVAHLIYYDRVVLLPPSRIGVAGNADNT